MKVISPLLSIIFLVEGITKLLALGFQINFFQHWGYPLWFMYTIGVLEISGVVGLWIPRLSKAANIGLLGLMFGAFYTHISRHDPVQNMSLAILTLILLSINLFLLSKRNLSY